MITCKNRITFIEFTKLEWWSIELNEVTLNSAASSLHGKMELVTYLALWFQGGPSRSYVESDLR